jgi:UDPglucose--hexose-1-phosphate uridylyltransferase
MGMTDAQKPHRRLNLLTGEWVLVSPHRMSRPWQGEVGAAQPANTVAHDPDCYLCAGNMRVGGTQNPDYTGVWVFDNDFPALLPSTSDQPETKDMLLVQEPESGVCRVICYTPHHSKTMANMTRDEVVEIVRVWAQQWEELSKRPDIGAVTIFENRGAMMGASNPHPHGQIWATASVPSELALEVKHQAAYFSDTGRPLLIDYVDRELASNERIVFANDRFVVLVPFWAEWPFETLIVPRRALSCLSDLDHDDYNDFAEALCHITAVYDRVFDAPFPYTMGLHQRPTRASVAGFVFHTHFYPPLLRSATVRKFMVGFEMLAMAQRDLTPEAAAARLREIGLAL